MELAEQRKTLNSRVVELAGEVGGQCVLHRRQGRLGACLLELEAR